MKNIITVLFLGCYSLVFTQFNTLTPKKVTSNEILKEQQSFQKQSTFKIEKEQKSIINRLFNAPTKKNLKKEIDSLKTLMLRYNVSRIEESKADSKIDNDSLLQNYKKQSTNLENSNTEKRIKKFDFVNEEESISKISMPLNNRMMVTSPFGWRVHPIFGANKLHNGADFKANYENVYAVLDGVVIASGWDLGGGGNYIKIRHSNSFITSYLHLSEMYYKAGEFVKAGFIIAKSGNTGNSTGAHLHFSVTENGKYINPIRFLNDLINANNLIANYYESRANSYNQH
ncbi:MULTISPECIES: M23 family metallopeptidase [Weeksellaceae]|uniref:M23 family metallopeptidase n=3 Tax=Chryseobacterium TaxID=59732 RepID=A0A3G6T7Y9_9FLAO|nr:MULTISPECIES: M23 family metallopeptidase [Weeksellaceae]AZA79695.1 M23 family metallopeptidase [Chryseobacterium sp. G0186]AZB25308.1 M23 family metallopeptidase [Chryseobacterium bernardetii]AZB35741.1 M23 family metallopeptidase [Chryseobacterium bernardetii]EFK35904.1 peptidase, M23 family [Chryseobacterium gleum ATCC 35910]EJC8060703.1 M23 family metallopeptidase [Elizabethkingia anophelis]